LGVAILRFHVHVLEEKKRTRCGAGAENPTALRYLEITTACTGNVSSMG